MERKEKQDKPRVWIKSSTTETQSSQTYDRNQIIQKIIDLSKVSKKTLHEKYSGDSLANNF